MCLQGWPALPCQHSSSSSSIGGARWVPAIDAEELQQQEQYDALLEQAPEEFLCPISLQLLTDPVVTPGGVTYNRCVCGDHGLLLAHATVTAVLTSVRWHGTLTFLAR
jgi:hypothetical protein